MPGAGIPKGTQVHQALVSVGFQLLTDFCSFGRPSLTWRGAF